MNDHISRDDLCVRIAGIYTSPSRAEGDPELRQNTHARMHYAALKGQNKEEREREERKSEL